MGGMTDTPKDGMDALTEMLAGGPPAAGIGIKLLCKQSARKAVNDVLDVLLQGSTAWDDGIIRLQFTSISETVLRDTVERAIERCTQ